MYLDAEKEAKKEYILSVCFETFMELGLEKTSMRDLCDANGFGSATMYYYFPSKDDIVCQCVQYERKRTADDLEKILSEAIASHNIEKLFDSLISLADEHRNKFNFILQVVCSPHYKQIIQPTETDDCRWDKYIQVLANAMNIKFEKLKPICYLAYCTIINYIIDKNRTLIHLQFDYLKNQIIRLIGKTTNI